jgi:glycosyltransferase involved in cell wall biosynthesis
MRVCMVAYSFYENDTRIRQYVKSLIAKGVQVDVIALRQEGQSRFETIGGANVYRIQQRERNEKRKWDYIFRVLLFLIKSFFFLSFRHMRSPYSLIHVHSVPDFEVFATLVPKLTGTKVILDIHDLVPEFYGDKFHAPPDSLIVNALMCIEKISCAFADHVIIANDLWAEKLCRRSVKPKKCTALINYPELQIFASTQKQLRIDNHFSLIYPGSLNRHQGLDIAIQAMAIVKDKIPDVRLHIYGDGPERKNLEALIGDLKLDNIVLLHDPVSLSEIADRMAASDAGIVPKRSDSFGNEAFSTKVMEFMAMGLPVIVSDTKIDQFYFNESLVIFFKAGDELDLAEKILSLYYNRTLRQQLIDNGLQFIKSNNWKAKEKIYFQIINSIFGASVISEE